MKPTDELKKEHQAILVMLRILQNVCQKLDTGEEVESEHLEQMLEFIRIFADGCHHRKEEDLLFPAMEKAGIPREGGPIGVMLEEHDTGRGFVRKMGEAIKAYKAGKLNDISKIVEPTRNYINLLSQHIIKEDNILFPMADQRLSPEKQRDLLKEFDKVEREKVGVGKHEEFHKLLHHLAEIYLR